jgi:VanZ family protein
MWPMSSIQRISRIAAWLLVLAIIVLSIVPAQDRPVTPLPHDFEHFGILVLTGMVFGIGYGRYLFPVTAGIAFSGAIELVQLYIPDRHARLSDFAIDAFAISCGIIFGAFVARAGKIKQKRCL